MEENLQGNVINLQGNMTPVTSVQNMTSAVVIPQQNNDGVNTQINSINTIQDVQAVSIQQPVQNITNTVPQFQESGMDTTKSQSSEDAFVVPTEILGTLLQRIKNSLTIDLALQISLSVQLIFSPEGLTMKATDGQNVLIQVANNVITKDTMSISVNLTILSQLISKITSDKLQIIPQNGRIIIKSLPDDTEKFEFILMETHDTYGKSLIIPDTYGNPNIAPQPLNYDAFRNAVIKSKVFMGNSNVNVSLNGVFVTNYYYSSDNSNAARMINDSINLPEGKSLYLTQSLTQMIEKLSLDSTKSTISYTVGNEGLIDAIQITDGTISIHGPTNPDYQLFPLSGCERLFGSIEPNSFVVDKKALINMLDKVSIFTTTNDKDACNFIVDGVNKHLVIESKATDAKQIVNITGDNISNTRFSLHVLNTITALKNLDDDNVVWEYVPVTDNDDSPKSGYVKIKDNNTVELLSYRF